MILSNDNVYFVKLVDNQHVKKVTILITNLLSHIYSQTSKI